MRLAHLVLQTSHLYRTALEITNFCTSFKVYLSKVLGITSTLEILHFVSEFLSVSV